MLFVAAFVAGFLDAIVGGGGLVQLPALLLWLPDAPISYLFGTNKLASLCGTGTATVQYLKRVRIPFDVTFAAALAALVSSFLGARAVTLLDPRLMKPLVLGLLTAVALYATARKELGAVHAPRFTGKRQVIAAVATGFVLGFYDGFFGPGTGTFLVVSFVSLFGYEFLIASAAAKVVNLATNVGALSQFLPRGEIYLGLAVGMAVCNMLGSVVGARLAILKGSRFVRSLFLVVVWSLVLRFGYEVLL